MTLRIAIVTNGKTPYRQLQFQELAAIPGCSLQVYYLNPARRNWEVDSIDNVPESVLPGVNSTLGWLNLGLRRIVQENDLVVIGGYYQPSYILLGFWCRLYAKPYVLLFDGISPSRIDRKGPRLRHWVKSWVVSGSAAIYANGTVSRNYFNQQFAYPEERIYNQFLTVDISALFNLAGQRERLRSSLRAKYNIPQSAKVLVFSGRLMQCKNVRGILDALSLLPHNGEYYLLILGDGAEKHNILQQAQAQKINVVITGFISRQLELFEHYFAGDVLVMPSLDDAWGLVINEAMAAGLPIIASSHCGAHFDLVRENENGFVVEPGNPRQLVEAIESVFHQQNYKRLGQRSAEIIREWSFESSKLSFLRMLVNLNVLTR